MKKIGLLIVLSFFAHSAFALPQETAPLQETAQALVTLQQLFTEWNTYHRTQVIPVLAQYHKSLAKRARPLDDNGLMLSAQVNHLRQVSACVFQAIERIEAYQKQPQQCGGNDCPTLREELAQLRCSTQLDPLKTPGLMEATPLEEDYPTGQMHTCAVCGKSIEIGKAYYDEAYTHTKGKVQRYRYFRHTTCSPASAEVARTYHDDAVQVQAPTYMQLQMRTWLAANLSTLYTHKATSTVPVKITSEELPTNVSAAQPVQPVASRTHSHAVDTVQPDEKVRCSVCGEEIHVGETYYKRTESQFMHRGGACAYSFFVRKHKVDEKSLDSYARSYGETTAEVESARADMKVLGLSMDTLRQLRTQEEVAQQQQQQAWQQQQRRSEKQIILNIQCRVYRNVTAQDVAQFKTQYAKQLERIARKTANHQTLTKPQQRLQKQYAQLLRDEQKTQECLALEQAAH